MTVEQRTAMQREATEAAARCVIERRAIHFGRIGPDTPCYRRPEISINDLFR
jgi:hypothetical protein